ncbi:MAG: hypothetical protein IPG18_18575 [Saprospiraceae bacterium]|nr:hypothetical protein [Saprospiraceae bacterium]
MLYTFVLVGLGVDPLLDQIPINEVLLVCPLPKATMLLLIEVILFPERTKIPATIGGVRAAVPIVELLKAQILFREIVVPKVVVIGLAEAIPITLTCSSPVFVLAKY